jgi:c-di-GMP-binding flagellar brake protein YcgR
VLRENYKHLEGRAFVVKSVEERRRFKRIYFSEEEGVIGIFKSSERSLSSSIKDISKGGLKLALTRDEATAFCKGDILFLNAIMGTANIEFDEAIEMEIKWMMEPDGSDQIAVGCEFKDMSENTRERMNRFVDCEMRWKGPHSK